MARIARQEIIAPNQLYHITVRGNNQQSIFLSKADFEFFLKRLKFYHQKMDFLLFGYVLMQNHFHLLVEAGEQNTISEIMRNINTSYVVYFKKKYRLSGHIFQGRFHARLIDKENYLLEAIRYLHLNPVRAGLVEKLEDFPYSSFNEYIGKIKQEPTTDCNEILEIFGGDLKNQRQRFREFIGEGL